MHEISVLKVDSPACFWARDVQDLDKYQDLLAQVNLFYRDRDRDLDLDTMRPSSLKEGQVCVAYWAEKDLWCRALVQFFLRGLEPLLASCFLVDHGEQLIVASHRIRVLVHRFLLLPFWVKKFQLAGIAPTTLRVGVQEEKAKLVPSRWWDSSATLHLHNLLQVSTQTEAAFVESESDCTSVKLYLTINNSKVCVNDDLVEKKYAYYRTGWTDCLASSTSPQRTSTLTSNRLVRRIPAPPGQTVTTKTPPACGSDGLLAASQVCSQHDDDTRSKVTEGWYSERLRGWDAAASTHRNSSEDSHESAALDRSSSQLRFLKFLHSDGSPQEGDPTGCETEEPSDLQPEEPAASDVCADQETLTCGLGGLAVSRVESAVEEAFSSTPLESGSEEKPCRSEQDLLCSEFLEWLNPGPLNPDPAAGPADDLLFPMDLKKSGILVHSALQLETCSSLDDAPLTDVFRWVLKKKQYLTLSPTDRYSWPSVARGNNTLIISPTAQQPLSYLHPLLSHILLASIYTCSSGPGPIAVLLCVGWKKVHEVYEVLQESKVGPLLRPMAVLLGLAPEEAKTLKIPHNCLLLVTTPFSLLRLLAHHCFLFMRVCHLVLDQADQLFTVAPDQMESILQHFQQLSSSDAGSFSPHQLLAVAKTWTGPMRGLLAHHMPQPCIVIGVPEETALYANVQQVLHVTQAGSRLSLLLALLELNPPSGQKTVIVTNSLQELEDVFKAVKSRSLFCLKTHQDVPEQLDWAVQQWRTDVGPGTHLILVTTDQCLEQLDIRDAGSVLHYGFPPSPGLFGRRILCMAQHFPNLAQVPVENPACVTRSVLLVTEHNARHVKALLRYLVRSGAPVSPELLAFAQDVHAAQEDKKEWRPLCSYLKSFGVCRDSSSCPDRHRFVPRLDQSRLPASGVVQVVPLYIKTASVFLGRMVGPSGEDFQRMSADMELYYAERRPGAPELQEGGLYALQEDKLFHRVRILFVQEPRDCLFLRVLVLFVDVGKEVEVRSHQLLQLPEHFHSLPPQAVEMVVCRVKPIDADTDWCPEVTRHISQKIRGLQHQARVVFSLGNTIFVDPMVRLTKVPGLKTRINEYTVQSEILTSRRGESNPPHLDLLRALCEAGHCSGPMEEEEQEEEQEEEEQGNVPAEAFTPPQTVQPGECLVPTLPALERIPLFSPPELPPQLRAPTLPPHLSTAALPPQLPTLERIPLFSPPTLPPHLSTAELPPQLLAPVLPPQLPAPALPPQILAPALPPQLPAPALPPQILAPALPPKLLAPALPPQLLAPALPPQILAPALPPQLPAPALPPQLLAPALPPQIPAPALPPQLLAPALPPQLPVCELRPCPPAPSEGGLEGAQIPDRKSVEVPESKWDRSGVGPSGWLTSCIVPRHHGVPGAAGQVRTPHTVTSESCDSARSYHPQVRWYQTLRSVVLTLKLLNPQQQSFCFHRDRLEYRGLLGGRPYRADLQLQQPVEAELCSWQVKANQPVVTLVKVQPGVWEQLTTSKNIFVRYDLEHIEEEEEEEEDGSEDGPFFLENTTHLLQDCSSDSDSD